MRKLHKSGDALRQEIELTKVTSGQVALWSLGNLGFVLKGSQPGACVAVDPFLTDSYRAKNPETEFIRAFASPLQPEDLAVDFLFITHEHEDHLDPETLRRLHAVSPRLSVVVPSGLVGLTSDLVPGLAPLGAQEGEVLSLGPLSVTAVSACHPKLEKDLQGRSLRLGYLFDFGDLRIYHSGDTLIFPALVETLRGLKPDVMILPINGGDFFRVSRNIVPNMNYREAVDLTRAVGADLVVPAHFDLFPNNRERPAHFADYLLEVTPEQKFHYFTAGERFLYLK
jgi:L-ascorbate metabolism protein UlaG (beta-lactamase superfamily)